jgi:hypothetical protein
MHRLLIPYAYCNEHRNYYPPDDPHIDQCDLYVGVEQVSVRRSRLGRLHFYRPGSGGGATGPETAAHIFAKILLKRYMRLYAVLEGEQVLIMFRTCEVEQRLNNRTPDVTIVLEYMWPPRFASGTTLLVEIHATNDAKRDPTRIPALCEMGYPCIEITLPAKAVDYKFEGNDPAAIRRSFERYMETVMHKPYTCTWLVPEGVERWRNSPDIVSIL